MSTDVTRPARRIPLALKLTFTAFVLVWLPKYWIDYGPTVFLYYCDAALFFTLAAHWLESPLLASAPAVGILMPQALWIVDFLATAAGRPVVGLTSYMFDPGIPLATRAISFFHFWLPLLLVWLVWRLGYDRRAFRLWTVLAWVLVMACYLWMPAPPPPLDNPNLPVNIDYVYGFNDRQAQTWMNQNLFVALMLVVLPALMFYPTHLVLRWTMRDATPVTAEATVEVAGAEA